jgi:hypothetical protein
MIDNFQVADIIEKKSEKKPEEMSLFGHFVQDGKDIMIIPNRLDEYSLPLY